MERTLEKSLEAVIEELFPLHDRVIVLENKEPVSKIIIVNREDAITHKTGTVIKVGMGIKDKDFEVAAGDNVIYGKSAGNEFTYKGVVYHYLKEVDIYAKLL